MAQIGTQGVSGTVLRRPSTRMEGQVMFRAGKHRGRRLRRAWRTFTLKSRGQRVKASA